MSYINTEPQSSIFNGHTYKADDLNGESQSPDPDPDPEDGQDKKQIKHRRNYQACEPCRERKVKCDLGDVDNPSKGPCKKCARESKDCWFRETRKKDVERAAKRQRTVSGNSITRTIQTIPAHSSPVNNGFDFASNPLSPTRSFAPATSPGAMSAQPNLSGYTTQPRSTPAQFSTRSNPFAVRESGTMNPTYSNTANAGSRTANGEDHVVMPQANSLAEAFTNTTDNMSVLVRAATTTEAAVNAGANGQRERAFTGSGGEIDLRLLPPPAAEKRQRARLLWSQMRFVRAGWFTADEALQMVEYFYGYLAPMTPVVIQDFSDSSTHRELLTEEPVLALAILAITSRYYKFKTIAATSRGFYVHEKLWDALRKIVQRLLWGQEQFGGGFTGAGFVPIVQSSTGQITWKGSLRTLGTIEALLLLTDWQPRALHFPPGDDENKLVGAGYALLEDEKPGPATTGNVPYSTWLEPAWRSDRMSWMLLGLAQSLAFELGVFDTRHEHCGGQHGPESECMRRRRIRRLVITYVSQISGRIGIQASLTPKQDVDPNGPDHFTTTDQMQKLWFDIASLMFDANREIFPSRETTARLIDTGEYKAAIERFRPRLEQWLQNFKRAEKNAALKPAMIAVLRMEFEYSRLYVNSLGLQRVVGQMAQQDRSTTNHVLAGKVGPVYDDNKIYIDEVRDAAKVILEQSCYGLGDLKALGYSPVRTFLRTLSALMFSLKLLSLGNEERVVRATFKLLKEMTTRMKEQVVDDVHLSPHTAELVFQLMQDVHGSMVRVPKQGSRGQTRQTSPQPQQPHSSRISYAGISDQESPDPLGQIPFADYQNQTFMMPPAFDPGNFDTTMFDTNVDPTLSLSGEDWISLPIDNLLNLDSSTVNQGYGGIGPTFGDRDMLSILTGSQLDQSQSNGQPPNFSNFGHGF